MKVLFISHKPPYPIIDGGCHAMDRMLRDFIYCFPNAKIDYLSIATEKHPEIKNSTPYDLSDVSFESISLSTRLSVFKAFIHLFNGKSYHISRFTNGLIQKKLSELMSKNQFDVIVFESIFAAAHVDQIKSQCSAHLIYRAHNIEHKIWNDLSQGEDNPFKKWYLKHLSKRLKSFELNFLNKVDSIFSISDIDQAFFKQYSDHSHYVPVSMIHELRAPKIEKSICFLGAFNWAPNKEGVLWFVENVFYNLIKQFPFIHFEIAGSFSEEISALSKTKNIRLHGFVDSSKEFMATHGIFVAPLLSGSGVKMKVIEAMSMGVPCVLSAHAAEGLDLPPIIPVCETKEDFIEKLSLLLNDEQHCTDIGNAGRKFIQCNFSTELVAKKISAVLKL